jgi:hypothetical protein
VNYSGCWGLWEITHTGCYIHFDSNNPCHVKREGAWNPVRTASTIRQEQDFHNEARNIKHELALNGYSPFFTDSSVKVLTVKSWLETVQLSSPVLGVCQKNSDILGTSTILGPSSKPATRLEAHSWKPDQAGILWIPDMVSKAYTMWMWTELHHWSGQTTGDESQRTPT